MDVSGPHKPEPCLSFLLLHVLIHTQIIQGWISENLRLSHFLNSSFKRYMHVHGGCPNAVRTHKTDESIDEVHYNLFLPIDDSPTLPAPSPTLYSVIEERSENLKSLHGLQILK